MASTRIQLAGSSPFAKINQQAGRPLVSEKALFAEILVFCLITEKGWVAPSQFFDRRVWRRLGRLRVPTLFPESNKMVKVADF
jgi:hypothetical protein